MWLTTERAFSCTKQGWEVAAIIRVQISTFLAPEAGVPWPVRAGQSWPWSVDSVAFLLPGSSSQDCCPPARVGFPPQRVSSPSNSFPVKPHFCFQSGKLTSVHFWFYWLLSQLGTSGPRVRSCSNLSPALLLVWKRSNPALLLSVVHFLTKSPSYLPEVHLSSHGPQCSLEKLICWVLGKVSF